jgi:iron complex outermembrane receptor protein
MISARRTVAASSAAIFCGLMAALTWSANAAAQEAPTASAENDDQQLREVTVTGTRIKRTTDFTTPSPTTVIDATTLENLGIVNVGQVLEMTPANTSLFTPQTTGGSSFFTGAYVADLRGLNGFFGTRTLTLIDGRRAVPTNTGDSFDLNLIPGVLLQRIDTVTGGASAAYGSGAVGGVINIILDHQLEGGKFNADIYDTHDGDARDRHVGAAYGHGLFDNRVHLVIGGEFEKSGSAECQTSNRSWCNRDVGYYQTGTLANGAPQYSDYPALGLTDSLNNSNGTLTNFVMTAPGTFNPVGPSLVANSLGNAFGPYITNGAFNGGNGVAPGGQGTPVNLYYNLITPVERTVATAMLTAKVAENITASLDLNWANVTAVQLAGNGGQSGFIGYDNPYLTPDAVSVLGPTTSGNGYLLTKDFSSQLPNTQYSDTTVKRISGGLDGRFGTSSWTWDAYGEYGLTERQQGSPTDQSTIREQMALDVVQGPNGPECRVTAQGGAFGAALSGLLGVGEPGGVAPYGFFTGPSYLTTAFLNEESALAGVAPPNPATGLDGIDQANLLAQGCVPVNPFGTQPLTAAQRDYISVSLVERLRQTQTTFALNASGDIWKGIGAGAFTMAAGVEWRQEVVHNDEGNCTADTGIAFTTCMADATDAVVQFGNGYGGVVNVNEAYLELNLPLLRKIPWARLLDFDLAARASRYSNKALYAVGIPAGAEGTSKLPTWKASLLYEPIESIRLRATQSRDSRAPDPRDLYFSQTFIAGSAYGQCGYVSNPNVPAFTMYNDDPCTSNLAGNVNLKPETANTTTIGLIFLPASLTGLQASADWFHIHLTNAINGATDTSLPGCSAGVAADCALITFNPYAYNSDGLACTTGAAAGVNAPVSQGVVVDCTGAPVKTGAAAYQQTDQAANIVAVNNPAYNGAFYDERGVDFSVNYVHALPDGSSLTARALTTWTAKETYQNRSTTPVMNELNELGTENFLSDVQPAARWRGNMSITWARGGFSLTPNMSWVNSGRVNNDAVTQLTNPTLYGWVLNNFPDATLAGTPGAPADAQAQAQAKAQGGQILFPNSFTNHMPSYFLLGLNAAYSWDKIPGIKTLRIFAQVNNLLNRSPPYNYVGGSFIGAFLSYTTNPIFYDQLGLAYRVGIRMSF